VNNFEEIARYHSPELTIDQQDTVQYEELIKKIALNKTFRDALKYQIRSLKWSQLTAFKINAGYLPAHYGFLISPLRFVDVPKIRTIIQFGDRVVLENSAYVHATSNVRMWVYEKIITLLEVRLRYYNDLARGFSETSSTGTAEMNFPSWYSENISGYWDGAGLPQVIAGTFFSPVSGPTGTQRPAVLSFVRPGPEPELWGWYLSIGETASSAGADTRFSLFIDPLKSPATIYSRKGKTPDAKRLQLECTLYIHSGKNSPFEQDIIDHALTPFIDENGETNQGIKARIIFDGNTFEIRQHPAKHGNSLIFRGEL
jgi:hypothetical protein